MIEENKRSSQSGIAWFNHVTSGWLNRDICEDIIISTKASQRAKAHSAPTVAPTVHVYIHKHT